MIKKFDLIAGKREELQEYIENLDSFDSWQIGKSFDHQVENFLLSREVMFRHIGPITYQGKDNLGQVVIHAAFVAIL
jgi:hypothetical protein